jgi:hypothetical protein
MGRPSQTKRRAPPRLRNRGCSCPAAGPRLSRGASPTTLLQVGVSGWGIRAISRRRDESAIELDRERLPVFRRVPPTYGRPGFAPLIAAGVGVLLLDRNAVLFWPNRVAADVAHRLLRCWGTCLVRCHLDGPSRTGCWTITSPARRASELARCLPAGRALTMIGQRVSCAPIPKPSGSRRCSSNAKRFAGLCGSAAPPRQTTCRNGASMSVGIV